MNNLHEALEVCLEAIDHGMDIESSLARYPDIADELRPILQASANAIGMAAPDPSVEVIRRNRAKLLQRAAQIRETRVKESSTRNWFSSLRRAAVALAVLAIVFMSGTGLVRASSMTLPGDNLYPVKRTWEDLSLLLTFDLTRRESLEVEHENERLEEVHELFAEGRSAEVDFAGMVTQQNGDEWLVSGITIVISAQTDLHDGPVFVGDAVRVFGIIQSDDIVLVKRIDRLPVGAKLPDIGNSGKEPSDNSNSSSGSNDHDNSGSGTENINSNDNNNDSSGPGSGEGNNNGNDNSSSGSGSGIDNGNDNTSSSSGSGSGIDNDNTSGSDSRSDSNSGSGSSNDNSGDDNSGSGGGNDNSNEDSSGSGGDD